MWAGRQGQHSGLVYEQKGSTKLVRNGLITRQPQPSRGTISSRYGSHQGTWRNCPTQIKQMETTTTYKIKVSINAGTVLLVSLTLMLVLAGANKWLLPLPWYMNTVAVVLALLGGLMAGSYTQASVCEDQPADAYHPPLLDAAAAAYVEEGGTHCPHCASQDITAGAMDMDVSIAWQDVKCCSCGATWTDEFKLTGLRQLKRPSAQGSE